MVLVIIEAPQEPSPLERASVSLGAQDAMLVEFWRRLLKISGGRVRA